MQYQKKISSKQSRIIKLLLVGALLLTLVFAGGCGQNNTGSNNDDAQEPSNVRPVDLNLAHFMSAQHFIHTNVLEPFAKEVQEKTEGRVNITIHPANSLVGASELYDAAVTGIADIIFTLPGYTPGRLPLTSAPDLPFMISDSIQGTKTINEIYETVPAIQVEYSEVKLLMFATTDIGKIMTKKPIESLEDLRGMRIRSPGPVQNTALEALGAIPVSLPASDIYDSLERGIVDGTMGPPSTIVSFNLHEIVTHILEDVDFYASPLVTVMNLSTWNNLAPQDQATIEELSEKYSALIGEEYFKAQERGYQAADDKGILRTQLSSDEYSRWQKELEPLVTTWISDRASRGLPAQEVYDNFVRISQKHK